MYGAWLIELREKEKSKVKGNATTPTKKKREDLITKIGNERGGITIALYRKIFKIKFKGIL